MISLVIFPSIQCSQRNNIQEIQCKGPQILIQEHGPFLTSMHNCHHMCKLPCSFRQSHVHSPKSNLTLYEFLAAIHGIKWTTMVSSDVLRTTVLSSNVLPTTVVSSDVLRTTVLLSSNVPTVYMFLNMHVHNGI